MGQSSPPPFRCLSLHIFSLCFHLAHVVIFIITVVRSFTFSPSRRNRCSAAFSQFPGSEDMPALRKAQLPLLRRLTSRPLTLHISSSPSSPEHGRFAGEDTTASAVSTSESRTTFTHFTNWRSLLKPVDSSLVPGYLAVSAQYPRVATYSRRDNRQARSPIRGILRIRGGRTRVWSTLWTCTSKNSRGKTT